MGSFLFQHLVTLELLRSWRMQKVYTPVCKLHPGDPAGHPDIKVSCAGVLQDDELNLGPKLWRTRQGVQLERVHHRLHVPRRVPLFVRLPTLNFVHNLGTMKWCLSQGHGFLVSFWLCDQMAGLFVQFRPFYTGDKSAYSIKIAKLGRFGIVVKNKFNLKITKYLNFCQWQNFTKSGHTGFW